MANIPVLNIRASKSDSNLASSPSSKPSSPRSKKHTSKSGSNTPNKTISIHSGRSTPKASSSPSPKSVFVKAPLLIRFEGIETPLTHIHEYAINLDIEIAPIITFCREMCTGNDKSCDWQHHINVAHNVVSICEYESRSKSVTQLAIYAAFLHNVSRMSISDALNKGFKRLGLDPFKTARIKEFLIHKKISLAILWIIDNISYKKEQSGGYPAHLVQDIQFARDIVADAYRIECADMSKIVDFISVRHQRYTQWDIYKSAVVHCYERMYMSDKINTQWGALAYQERFVEIKEFLHGFHILNKISDDPLIITEEEKALLAIHYGK
jgi:hypothetical protein